MKNVLIEWKFVKGLVLLKRIFSSAYFIQNIFKKGFVLLKEFNERAVLLWIFVKAPKFCLHQPP